jgi:hypothetical protein
MNSVMTDEGRPEMDNLLHDYFQAELPKPWPTFKAPQTVQTKSAASYWSRSLSRVALAVCVATLVAGYLMLGSFFPRTQAPVEVEKAASDAAFREKGPKKATPTPPQTHSDELPTPMGTAPANHKSK